MKKFLLGLLTGVLISSVPAAFAVVTGHSAIQKPFDDVNEDSWYYNYANNVRRLGIMDGYSDNTFRANETVNRGQIAKIISEGLNLTASSGQLKTVQDKLDALTAKVSAVTTFPGDCYYKSKWYKNGDFPVPGLQCYSDGTVSNPIAEF